MKHLFEFDNFNEGISGLFKSAMDNMAKENPEGSNKGEKINPMLTKADAAPGDPWCAAYVYSTFTEAGLPSEVIQKIPKTPRVNQNDLIDLFNFVESYKNVTGSARPSL